MKEVAVLIPCYNEEVTIKKVIDDFRKNLPEAKVYVYNNNSTDKTKEIALENGAIVVDEFKQGKGNVIKSMFADVEADIYLMVDGDDTYDASFARKMVELVKCGKADMVVGDRISNGNYMTENKRKFHNAGNSLVKKTINFLFRSNLKDILSGYRCFSKEFVKNIPIQSKAFEIETELTVHALDNNYKIVEMPIIYRDRPDGSVSKLNTFKDGLKVLKMIFSLFKNYRPIAFFGFLGLLCATVGLLIGIPVIVEFVKYQYVYKLPSAVLATGLMSIALELIITGITLETVVAKNRQVWEMSVLRYKQIEKLNK